MIVGSEIILVHLESNSLAPYPHDFLSRFVLVLIVGGFYGFFVALNERNSALERRMEKVDEGLELLPRQIVERARIRYLSFELVKSWVFFATEFLFTLTL